jgi:hypothetical protein
MPSWDWDDVLAYTTTRRVKVRHATLGGLYYLTLVLIVTCAHRHR